MESLLLSKFIRNQFRGTITIKDTIAFNIGLWSFDLKTKGTAALYRHISLGDSFVQFRRHANFAKHSVPIATFCDVKSVDDDTGSNINRH